MLRKREGVSRLMDDLGRLARGLNPSLLDDLGLPTALRRHVKEEGRVLGLHGILERASIMGGTATIDSRLGRGTTIDVRIPLEGRKARRRRGAPPA